MPVVSRVDAQASDRVPFGRPVHLTLLGDVVADRRPAAFGDPAGKPDTIVRCTRAATTARVL